MAEPAVATRVPALATEVICIPDIVEKKVDTIDVEYVLSREQLEKTIVVFSPKNPFSAQQKRKCTILPEKSQNPNAEEEEFKRLNNLPKLLAPGLNEYVKFQFDGPPLKLLSKLEKIAGPGQNPNQGKNKKDGESNSMVNWSHGFWLVCTTDGLKPSILEAEGGAQALAKKQLNAHKLLVDASIILERKRFDHPETREEMKDMFTQQMEMYQSISVGQVNVTPDQVWNNLFKLGISQHEHCKIIANLKPSEGQRDKGFACKSKAWYKPKDTPTDEENEEAVTEYTAFATYGDDKFKIEPLIIAGLRQGLRPRRVPIYAKIGDKLELLEQPIDPCGSLVLAGDFVIPRWELHMYSNVGGPGQTLLLQRLTVISQATNEQNRTLELADKYKTADDYQYRQQTKKIKREIPGPPVPVPAITNSVSMTSTTLPGATIVAPSGLPQTQAVKAEPLAIPMEDAPVAPAPDSARSIAVKKTKPTYMAPPPEENQQSFADDFD